MDEHVFTCPMTGLEFTIHDEGDESYIVHPITHQRIKLLYDVERDLLCIPAYAFKHMELVSLSKAVKEYGKAKQLLHHNFKKGNIKGVKIGSTTYLVRSSIEAFYAKEEDDA